jgi:putative glycosyltransferase (TIGR04372 family)
MKPHRVYLNPEGYFEGELNNLVHLQDSKIRIPESEVKKFEEKLPFDIGTKDKTVYLALRDTAYTEKLLEFDGEYAKYRNMDESQIKTIIDTLTKNNFKVIRGGNKANPLTEVTHNDFFDYSNSTIKNDFNDLVLASIADFCIGGDTGLHNLPLLFRKRMYLISTPSFTNKLASPLIKLVSYCDFIDVKTKKVLNLQQLNERGVISTTGSTDLFALGVTVQRMDETSISKFILEVLEVESGRWEPSSESLELKNVFLYYLSPHGFKKDALFNFPNFWAKDSKWLA